MSYTKLALPGYRDFQQLYDGSRTAVYRGVRVSDTLPVVIKLLKTEYPTLAELMLFRNQYAIAKSLDLPGIVKPIALENYGNGLALVMEDTGSISLADYIAPDEKEQRSLSLDEFLAIATQITEILGGLIGHRIVHKDIKPRNILIDPDTKAVKLIDFSISAILPPEESEIENTGALEGTLAYMSPEQTGRTSRGIDYRTDFYSLGVTFYEMLTGQLPFQFDDPMELVHAPIARQPSPPIEVNTDIPQAVSELIMKLMAKTPEDRYQTAKGLSSDLENCLAQYRKNGTIEPFPLGEKDFSNSDSLAANREIAQQLPMPYSSESSDYCDRLFFAAESLDSAADKMAQLAEELANQNSNYVLDRLNIWRELTENLLGRGVGEQGSREQGVVQLRRL